MERIASFCVDHTRLERGMYISRVDGDVVTYDIRMKKNRIRAIIWPTERCTPLSICSPPTPATRYMAPASSMSGPWAAAPGSICSPAACPTQTPSGWCRTAFRFMADYAGDIPGASGN